MHYLVYRITHILTGKSYIGRHVTSRKHDGYMGSGAEIRRALRIHGHQSFKKEILFEAQSEAEMLAKEKEFVVIGPTSYNMIRGGGRGGIGAQRKRDQKLFAQLNAVKWTLLI